jgi:hypothetical protein
MYTHQIEQLADQRQAELHRQTAPHGQASPTWPGHQPGQARWLLGRQAIGHPQHRHPIRRRAGYALVSLGLRMAYVAGED